MIGDVDLDKEITIRDATEVQLFVAKFAELLGNKYKVGDTNGDDNVNIRDATNIQMFVAHFNIPDSKVGQYIGGDNPVVPTEPVTNPTEPTTEVDDTITVYFKNTANWSQVYIHYWKSTTDTTVWPGVKMNHVTDNIYSYDVPNTMTGVIFNNNSGVQTGDLTMPTVDDKIFDFNAGTWFDLFVG